MHKTLMEKRAAAMDAVRAALDKYKAAPTDDNLRGDLETAIKSVDEIDAKLKASEVQGNAEKLLAGASFGDTPGKKGAEPRSLGEHFAKHGLEMVKRQKDGERLDFSVPEFEMKAASEPMVRPLDGSGIAGWGTTFERSIVNQRREQLVVADLMGSANVTQPVIKYLVEKAKRIAEGAFATVAEGAQKPYIRYDTFDVVTESLSKIAALTKISDEMAADYGFIVDWINNQLVYDLSVAEEYQLVQGDGAGSNVRGLLNREGIQEFNIDSTDPIEQLKGIFEASRLPGRATNLSADAVILNELDYGRMRLAQDANGQFLAGGPFTGQYGNGNMLINPPVWGLKTATTNAAVKAGTYVLGNFRQGATVLRKGGVRVDSANQNDVDFEHNLITLRAEERVGLMVPLPAAFVTGTLGTPAGA
ncbi:phage major capsid protein [Corynebacterium lipophiloflavum]|uniref:Phage major capsid protein, HK97 family n=1 Tax=Corynebacterium lipophiloflavum (strain ATCC 700352 / DSM 44291 / CCUG 37336 / JCM 10383 / DMMZ 1944) TaxID=525263 RepID=C0XU08_CORLD|nr:phage major capsid protein [Corynebacterium lipophiloflavum]EEI16270.1 putative phage major capsid protein, HK97 family [Corynebacterium lipophiloflavum DSM 44291]